ncbi:MAG TPA: type 1 glutamine amidotransferase domain-containing protein [Candidatus Aquilonibacter sp.]|nr:type 1 glutamine amidotransferase domain-containing protein [Candidatus Aquilonibacter sp.]
MDNLKGLRVAILVDNGFERVELTDPRKALEEAGASSEIVSPQEKQVRALETKDWGDNYPVDKNLDEAQASSFDALLLPGGVMNPDRLRMNPKAVAFVKSFVDEGKPIAAICHGPWTLIETGAVKGRKITSWPSLKTDLRNAGADWEDREVIVDRNIVSSRKPDDIPAFNREMMKLFAQRGSRKTQTASRA